MNILLTGSASHLARVLLPRLCAHTEIEKVIGVDLKTTNFQHEKFQQQQLDVRAPALAELLPGIDAIIHMAFVVLRSNLKKQRHDRDLIRDINVAGSQHVFQLGAQHGVKNFIHLSSASVYGAWPDNPDLISEAQPLRAMPGFSYAEDKVAVEEWLTEFEQQHSELRIVRLRPHVILGPHAQPFLLRLLRQPFYPRFAKPQPLTQCVWEEDVVTAIISSLFYPVRGAFNLAAQPPLAFRDMLRLNHKTTVALPYGLLRRAHKLLWKFTAAAEEPSWMDGMRYSLAVDTRKAQQQLHWQASLSCEECIRQAVKLPPA